MNHREEHPRMIYQIEETRKKILDIALNMFLVKGLFATQMKDIAKAVGISRTSLYRYFRDKPHLAIVLLCEIINKMKNDWLNSESHKNLEKSTGIEYLKGLFQGFYLSPKYFPEWTYIAEFDAFFSGVRAPQEFTSILKENLDEKIDLVVPSIMKGQKDGTIRKDIDPLLCAGVLKNAIKGLRETLILRGTLLVELEEYDKEKVLEELLDYIFQGIQTRK